MAKGYDLGDLRAAIEESSQLVLNENADGTAPNGQVLGRLKRERASLIRDYAPQLIDMALIKLLNDVAKRKRKEGSLFFQQDLFAKYPKLPSLLVIKRGSKSTIGKLTLREVRSKLERRKSKASLRTKDDLERIVDDFSGLGMSDDDTFEAFAQKIASSEEVSERNLYSELQPH